MFDSEAIKPTLSCNSDSWLFDGFDKSQSVSVEFINSSLTHRNVPLCPVMFQISDDICVRNKSYLDD